MIKENVGVKHADKEFKEAMADAASSVVEYFKGNIFYKSNGEYFFKL